MGSNFKVIVEIENGLYGIMYGPALESVDKEAKFLLRPEMNRKWAFPIGHCWFRGNRKFAGALSEPAITERRSFRGVPSPRALDQIISVCP